MREADQSPEQRYSYWQEMTFALHAAQIADYEDALMQLGAMSLTLRDAADQPLLEPAPAATPVWDNVLLTAMFTEAEDVDDVARRLQSSLSLSSLPAFRTKRLAEREWRSAWMEHFQPMSFGRRLWICPSGYARPQQAQAVVVHLDPGLAFGSGAHPTTAMCLQWLDGHCIEGKTIADFGCGSGVLAIAAAKLGASRVYAIDNDPQALQAAAANADLNGVQDIVIVFEPQAILVNQIDLLLANILLKPLLSLREQFVRLLKPEGRIVLSGLLLEQRRALQAAYSPDFIFGACEQSGNWLQLSAVKRK